MGALFSYSLRNLLTRRLTTALTAGGMALVVFVFAAILMLSEGLRVTLVQTGSENNAVVLRKGAKSEMESWVERGRPQLIETRTEVALDASGQVLAAREVVVLIALPKRGTDKASNVIARGIGANSLRLRPQVRIVEGRLPRFGVREIMVGNSVARRFNGTGIGEVMRFGGCDWTVTGIFDAGATGFSSEVWGDANQLMPVFRRSVYSVVVVALRDKSAFQSLKDGIENDPRMTLQVKREDKFYEEQSEMMAKFLNIMGLSLTTIFSIGAIIGAMITMHAAVANRVAEIGTLRAIGFRRSSILATFVLESLLLGLLGGGAGLFLATFLRYFTISTMNFQTFSELAFSFALTPGIAAKSLLFGAIMGLLGGVLPAIRASRLKIVEALRAV